MFQEIDEVFVKECTDALEFYDENGILPWEKKRINVMINAENLKKFEGRNRSKIINEALSYVK